MNLNLVPLGDRILIRPEERPEKTDSGLHVVEHRKPHTAGWVVAVGPCEHPKKAVAHDMARRLSSGNSTAKQAAQLIRSLVAREPEVRVGDYVLFSWQVGQLFETDDERLLIMRESDILAVVDEPEQESNG